MISIFLTGTAGSGKSLLTKALQEWFRDRGQDVITCNLDPGVLNLPYEPEVDIRNYIDYNQIMEEYSLGPNGALILASDMAATRLPEIQQDIDSYNSDYVIIDTPGQTELFAFRESGHYIATELKSESKILLFIFDPKLCNTPSNFLSLTLLYASVGLRIKMPRIAVLSKKDISLQETSRILKWSREASSFEEALNDINGEQHFLYSKLFNTLRSLSYGVDLYPVSSVTGEGLVALVGEISRIASGGEEMLD
jgi:GTPase SAR1 family protein